MKRVDYWRWYIMDPVKGKMRPTRHVMDEATALARHPEATRVPNTLEVRELPETDEEKAANWPSAWQRTKT